MSTSPSKRKNRASKDDGNSNAETSVASPIRKLNDKVSKLNATSPKLNYDGPENPEYVIEKPKITLFTHPFKTLYIFSIIILRYLKYAFQFIFRHFIIFFLLSALIILPHVISQGSHTKVNFQDYSF